MNGQHKDSLGVAALVAGALLFGSGPAHAAAPKITSGPDVVGAAHVGAELRAQASWTGDPPLTASWSWLRCARPVGSCSAIGGATTDRYRVSSDDLGAVLRVRLEVANGARTDDGRSKPTAAIGPVPVPAPALIPTPTPTATAAPTATPSPPSNPSPSPSPGPVVFDSASPAPAVPAAPVLKPARPAAPRVLRPFPVVRIKGVLTVEGARVTLLQVRAPRGVRIAVRCRGMGCPRREFTARPGARRLRPFERTLRAGTRLDVRITKPGHIGKYTSIVIRRGLAPARRDRCLASGGSRPVRCPSG